MSKTDWANVENFQSPPLPSVPVVLGGLALRDYFAGHALEGWISNSTVMVNGQRITGTAEDAEVIASASYVYADAMLKARQL